MPKILITGANGFIGKNLQLHLSARKDVEIVLFTRADDAVQLSALLQGVEFVFHLAGTNRPQNPEEFISGNVDLTRILCDAVISIYESTGKKIPLLYASSTQASQQNSYGLSKLAGEKIVAELDRQYKIPAYVFRLPNVFGKWCRPDYNSAVATFCHNIARDLPIKINDPSALITLVYIDDVIENFVRLMEGAHASSGAARLVDVAPQYQTTVGELAQSIQGFRDSRATLMTERVGVGFQRALYATYVSYLPTNSFAYPVQQHSDPRGVFVEMLKTPDSGQFSFFTAHPGVTRGGHYHNTKTEKFLVIKGRALFKFRHMHTGEMHELLTDGKKSEIVETIPGWTHDITNVGTEELVVMLWANEVFDRARPDTYACPL